MMDEIYILGRDVGYRAKQQANLIGYDQKRLYELNNLKREMTLEEADVFWEGFEDG